MRVLQLHTRYRQPGGEDVAVAAEAAALRAHGHEVHALHMANPEGAGAAAVAFAQAPWNRTAHRTVRDTVRRLKPDVVHVHNTWFAMSPAVLDAVSAAPAVVMTLHNYRTTCANSYLFRDGHPCQDCVGSHPWHAVQHACYQSSRPRSAVAAATIALHRRRRTFADGVDVFLATTPFAKSLATAAGLPGDRILVAPHAVGDPGERACPPSVSDDVLVVGRLSPEKGVHLAVQAFTAAPGRLRLLVVGDGPERAALEAQAGPSVRFLGRQTPAEVRSLMLASRALLFPSLAYETFGLSLVEAMAAGLPVTASDLGGSPWILGDAAGGLVPPGNPAAWRRCLTELADDALVRRRGAAGRARWRETFHPDAGLHRLLDAYDAALARGSARGLS